MERQGVVVLANKRVWMCVREIRIINTRIMYVGVLDCDSCICTGNGEMRGGKRWLEELKGCIDVCEDRGKVEVIGDMKKC